MNGWPNLMGEEEEKLVLAPIEICFRNEHRSANVVADGIKSINRLGLFDTVKAAALKQSLALNCSCRL
jgi:hypothetical protein